MDDLTLLIQQVRACRVCEAALPHQPRPVLQIDHQAKILVAGQAPGRKVHESGIPFNDASGERLREWMGVSKSTFYDSSKIAILPMGFCYPGTGKSGDNPPRPECAKLWRAQLLTELNQVQLTLAIGQYAHAYHLQERAQSVTENVKAWQRYWPNLIPLPHPSPRNNLWLRRNPWFEKEVIPNLQQRIQSILGLDAL